MVAQWKLPWLHDYWGCCLSRWARVMTAKGEGLLCSLANWQLVTVTKIQSAECKTASSHEVCIITSFFAHAGW